MAPPARFRTLPSLLRGRALLAALLVLLVLPELVLTPAGWGLWGSAAWRPLAFQYGAFWSGLLRDWQPNYALQPVLMFVTYAGLHAGLGHLGGNLLVLAPLGDETLRWLGPGRAAAVAGAATLGGAVAFGLLSRDPSPMIGASGMIFGLAGALVVREALEPGGRWRALALGLGLALANLAMWALMTRVAWEAHAGGALAGAAAAWALGPRRVDRRPDAQEAGVEAPGAAPLADADPGPRAKTLS